MPGDWEREGGIPIELCALHWKHNVEEILANRDHIESYLEVRYEDLVRRPRMEIERIVDHCDLPLDTTFVSGIPETLPDMDRKWREALSDEDVALIEGSVGDTLRRLGYLR